MPCYSVFKMHFWIWKKLFYGNVRATEPMILGNTENITPLKIPRQLVLKHELLPVIWIDCEGDFPYVTCNLNRLHREIFPSYMVRESARVWWSLPWRQVTVINACGCYGSLFHRGQWPITDRNLCATRWPWETNNWGYPGASHTVWPIWS